MAEAPAADLPVVLGQEYRVKLGKSFTFPKANAFHTIKYDFKPLSVDPSNPGRLKVGEGGDEVNVSLPVVQAESADDVAQFRGPKKMCTKECVLIIDTQTGEAILEKISNTVQLKSVRDGRKLISRDRSVSPTPYPVHKSQPGRPSSTGPPPASGKQATGIQSTHKGQKKPTKSRTKAPKSEMPSRTLTQSPSDLAKAGKKARKVVTGDDTNVHAQKPSPQQQQLTAPSMPTIVTGFDTISTPDISPIHSNNPTPELIEPVPVPTKKIKVQSGSSSMSSSSSSSDSSESDSEGETTLQTNYQAQLQIPHIHTSAPQMGSHMTQMGSHMTQPGSHMTQMGSHMTQPGGHMPQQGSHMTQPGSHMTQPGGYMTQQGSHFTQPGSHMTQQGGYMTQPGSHMSQQGSHMTQQGGYMTQPGSHMSQPGGYMTQPGSYMTQPGSHMTQPGSHMTQPGSHMTQPGSHMTQPGSHMTQPGGYMTQPGSHMTQQGSHMTQPGSHMTQPGKMIGHQDPQSSSSSSSESDSDSSSGSDSSSSDSSENDREVASAFAHTAPMRQRTMSQLRNDLHLSDSGSDSDT